MQQRNSEKNQEFLVLNDKFFFLNLLTFNFRADIMTRYTFNQVRLNIYIYRFYMYIDSPDEPDDRKHT